MSFAQPLPFGMLPAMTQDAPRQAVPTDAPAASVQDDAWGRMMAAAQQGDRAAYRRLLEEVAVWLKRYYARRLPPALLDDAVQDALLAIHEKRHTYDPAKPLGPWLAAIARYKWIDRLRSLKTRATEPLPDALAVEGHEDLVVHTTSLNRLLGELRPAQSQVIRLVKLQGMSVEEAAGMTGQSVSLVKVNIHRGLRRLTRPVQGGGDDT